jgi:hypothetical protein
MTSGYSTLGFTGRCCEILFQIKALGQSLGYLSTWTISPWGLWNFPVAGIARICTNGLCEDSSFRLIPAKGRLTLPQLRAGVKDISLISESYKAPVSLLLISSVLTQPLTSKFSYLLVTFVLLCGKGGECVHLCSAILDPLLICPLFPDHLQLAECAKLGSRSYSQVSLLLNIGCQIYF